jgi:hypothetical protein
MATIRPTEADRLSSGALVTGQCDDRGTECPVGDRRVVADGGHPDRVEFRHPETDQDGRDHRPWVAEPDQALQQRTQRPGHEDRLYPHVSGGLADQPVPEVRERARFHQDVCRSPPPRRRSSRWTRSPCPRRCPKAWSVGPTGAPQMVIAMMMVTIAPMVTASHAVTRMTASKTSNNARGSSATRALPSVEFSGMSSWVKGDAARTMDCCLPFGLRRSVPARPAMSRSSPNFPDLINRSFPGPRQSPFPDHVRVLSRTTSESFPGPRRGAACGGVTVRAGRARPPAALGSRR